MECPPDHNLVALRIWATDEEYNGWAYYLYEEASYPWGMKRISWVSILPYETVDRRAKLFLSYKGVRVYETYKLDRAKRRVSLGAQREGYVAGPEITLSTVKRDQAYTGESPELNDSPIQAKETRKAECIGRACTDAYSQHSLGCEL